MVRSFLVSIQSTQDAPSLSTSLLPGSPSVYGVTIAFRYCVLCVMTIIRTVKNQLVHFSLTQFMNQHQEHFDLNRTLYPPSPYYNSSWSAMTHPDGFVVSCGNPLTTESQTSTIFVPSPSYKEVRDVLSMKVNNLSRKEKRKLIKNKRKRIRRKEVTLLANSLIKEVKAWKANQF